jgi:hypothetical protein
MKKRKSFETKKKEKENKLKLINILCPVAKIAIMLAELTLAIDEDARFLFE